MARRRLLLHSTARRRRPPMAAAECRCGQGCRKRCHLSVPRYTAGWRVPRDGQRRRPPNMHEWQSIGSCLARNSNTLLASALGQLVGLAARGPGVLRSCRARRRPRAAAATAAARRALSSPAQRCLSKHAAEVVLLGRCGSGRQVESRTRARGSAMPACCWPAGKPEVPTARNTPGRRRRAGPGRPAAAAPPAAAGCLPSIST